MKVENLARRIEIRDLSGNRTLVLFGDGDEVAVTSGEQGAVFVDLWCTVKKSLWHGMAQLL